MSLTKSGLSDKEIDKYIYSMCGEFAIALYDELTKRGLKGLNFAILTTDGESENYGWVHVCVQHGKDVFIDAYGWGNGDHILDNDVYYDSFETSEIEDAEDITLRTVPYKDLHKITCNEPVYYDTSEETRKAVLAVADKYCK